MPDISADHHSESSNERPLPSPNEKWKLSLQEVKILHLQRRHKQCASRATEILNKPDIQV